MIYLRTGANGAGKTLLTLRDVHAKSIKESRPVFYNGRFDMVEDGPLKSWTKIDAKEWETVPDGAIFLFDECHNDFPVRSGKDPAPGYIKALAEHRRRGFDFYLITQHPLNIDSFVRRLIGSPGWHQHLKRASGAPLVSVIEWPSVNEQCQKAGAGESGSVAMQPFPKEVFAWYRSTSLDTSKLKVPFRVWVLLACVLLVPLGIWGAVATFNKANSERDARLKALAGPVVTLAPGQLAPRKDMKPEPVTAREYVQTFAQRIDGLPFTAPRYDELTKPTQAPFPAACISSVKRCECYTQQATKLNVPEVMCRQMVASGYFKDWGQDEQLGIGEHSSRSGSLTGETGNTGTVGPSAGPPASALPGASGAVPKFVPGAPRPATAARSLDYLPGDERPEVRADASLIADMRRRREGNGSQPRTASLSEYRLPL